ncbi:MAG: SLC26A/SulP transporter family protein [Elusimicrobia bacterium]|nr:SLC26A/SulP transporter family protein [Elusimicrobiota bacterium]
MDAQKRPDSSAGLSFKDWPGDVFGGLAGMLVALPQAIAFGVVIYSALGPENAPAGAKAGLVGAAVIGITAALFGGTPRLVSAPCAPAAAVMAALAAGLAAQAGGGDPARLTLLLTLTALLSGGLQLLYGALGGGRLIKYIPYPVVTGYLSGVAVLIFLGQLPKLFGLGKAAALWQCLSSPGQWQLPAVVVGAAAMSAMIAAPKITRRVPGPILGLAGGLLAYFVLGLFFPALMSLDGNALVVGRLGAEGAGVGFERWAALSKLRWEDLRAILTPALTLSVLLSMDTLKTCVVLDALTHSRHDSNRELRGQGLANAASAALGGVPGAGTMGATLVNMQSGGKTRLSGVLEGVFCLAAFLLLSGLIAWVPISALAGILLVVAWRMFDRKSFKLLRQRSTLFDFAVTASVVGTAVALDLMAAAGVGLALSILLFIREQIQGSVIRRKTYGNEIFSKQKRLQAEMDVLEKQGSKTVICELQGTLFFGTTDQLLSELEGDLRSKRFVILDLRRVQSLDFTAAHLLQQIESDLREREGNLLLSSLPTNLPSGQDLMAYFDEVGLVAPSSGTLVFDALDDALAWAEDRILEEACLEVPAGAPPLGMEAIDLFREFEPELRQALAACLVERSFKASEKVFSQGNQGDELYVVRKGKVRVSLPLDGGRTHHLATFRRGDFFGDMAFVDKHARSADAVAMADSELYVLSRARFNEAVRAHAVVGTRLFARLARALALRLRQTDAELRALQES